MNGLWMGIHGIVLAAINFVAIMAGFMVYKMTSPADQLAVQLPVAVVLSVGGFVVWTLIARRGGLGIPASLQPGELLTIYGVALVGMPLLFVPLHFMGTGYLTSFSNVTAAWLFQVPTNALALAAVGLLMRSTALQHSVEH